MREAKANEAVFQARVRTVLRSSYSGYMAAAALTGVRARSVATVEELQGNHVIVIAVRARFSNVQEPTSSSYSQSLRTQHGTLQLPPRPSISPLPCHW